MFNTCSIFAFLHIKCFTYKVYVPDPSTIEGDLKDHRTPRLKSLGHAMNPMETLRELWAGIIYMFRMWRGKETDKQARRVAAHQGVFGHSRSRVLSDVSAQSESLIRNGQEKKREKKTMSPLSQVESGGLDAVLVDVEREVYLGSERQWLGVGDNHDYFPRSVREKSDDFEDAVAKELYKRGYTLKGKVFSPFWLTQRSFPKIEASRHSKVRSASRDIDIEQGHVRGASDKRSWWRSIYQRVSQSGGDDEQEKRLSPHPKRKSVSRPSDPVQGLPLIEEMPTGGTSYAYEDPPPPSTLGAYRSSRPTNNERKIPRKAPPRVSPPVSNFAHQPPEPAKPKTNPPQLGRSDSLLGRVFAYLGSDAHATNTDLDHGTESQPSRPTSLWRAGTVDVVPKHVPERSNVTQANVSDSIDPQLVNPIRGDVVGVGGVPSQDEEPPTPPPKRSHFRDTADHHISPPRSPPAQQPHPVVDHRPAHGRSDPPLTSLLPPQSPGIPELSTGYDLVFPLPPLRAEFEPQRQTLGREGHVDPRTVYPFPMSEPCSRSPPQQDHIAGPSSPLNLTRPGRASRNEALLRPFPEPVHHPPTNMGPTRFAPSRSKLTIPAPLAQPLPRGSGSLKRNRTNTMPNPQKHVSPGEGPYLESRSWKNSQPIPAPHRTTDPNYVPRPLNPPSMNPRHRTSQPLPVLQETNDLYMSPPSSPPQRSSRRSSAPPMSALPPNRPGRSNAINRKSPGSRSPTRATSPRMNLLAELRGSPPVDSGGFSRYPVPGPGSGIGSPPRNTRTRLPPSPKGPPFVNTHMLPSPTNSPRSDVEEWASAVSSFPPSVKAKRP